MPQRSRIPRELIKKFENDICFFVSIDHCMIKAVEPITKWLAPMGYEISNDFTVKSINELLALPVDITASRFDTYEEAKIRIDTDIVISKMSRRGRR